MKQQTEICFACSKPIFDKNGEFIYVKTSPKGFVISRYKDGVAIPKLKNGNKIPTTYDVVCSKNDKGARLLKENPTHSLRFKIVGEILFVAYAVAISNNNKNLYDTYSRKKGSIITAKRIDLIETDWHKAGTIAEEMRDINDFLPRVVCDTFEHYLTIALYRLNIHGHTTLLIKGDSRANEYHQIEFEACDNSCPSCNEAKLAKLINLGVIDKEDETIIEEFEAEEPSKYIFAIGVRASDKAIGFIFQNRKSFASNGINAILTTEMFTDLSKLAVKLDADQEEGMPDCSFWLYKTDLSEIADAIEEAGIEVSDELHAAFAKYL